METNTLAQQKTINIEALKEMVETKELQLRLQEINTLFVEAKVRELVAIQQMSQLQAQQDMVERTLTEEDFVNNPDLTEQGFKVGETIGIPKAALAEFETKKSKLKVSK